MTDAEEKMLGDRYRGRSRGTRPAGRETADHVEQRGPTSAMGADESHRLHRCDADVDVVEDPDSAEVLADPLRVE